VTEYALPPRGERELYMLRGRPAVRVAARRHHNDKYALLTDHFSYVLGRLDVKTGEATEIPSRCRKEQAAPRWSMTAARGQPGGGAHELQFERPWQ